MVRAQVEDLYEQDFYAWTQEQAEGLRRLAELRPNLPLDLLRIAEEIQDLGKSERDAVLSLAEQIIQHLLLIGHSPATEQRRHWMDEIDEFRGRAKRKLSPTIHGHLAREIEAVYVDARHRVARKMRRHGEEAAAVTLPEACPYTVEQILGDWEPAEVALES